MDWLIRKEFIMHSGDKSDFKIECDALTDEELETAALLLSRKVGQFSHVVGIPHGGIKLAFFMKKYRNFSKERLLIVDDVYTTGRSMSEAIKDTQRNSIFKVIHTIDYSITCAVIFARKKPTENVHVLFQM
jgi:orotate phosphoribosyltransferase